jgi:hypothetical protein
LVAQHLDGRHVAIRAQLPLNRHPQSNHLAYPYLLDPYFIPFGNPLDEPGNLPEEGSEFLNAITANREVNPASV